MSNEQDHLIITTGSRAGEKIPLENLPLVIGRIPPADLVISIEGVSRKHALLSREASGYVIEDLGSSNGTFINNERIQAPRAISNGDLIRLGLDIELQLAVMPVPKSDATFLQTPHAEAIILNAPAVEATVMNVPAEVTPEIFPPAEAPVAVNHPVDNPLPESSPGTVVSGSPLGAAAMKTPVENPKVESSSGTVISSSPLGAASAKTPGTKGQTVMMGNPVAAAVPPQLVVNESGLEPRIYTINGPRLRIGRLPENDVVLNNRFVSRYHVELEKRGDDYYLIPLPNISNALLVDGVPVMEPTLLKHGMKIRIGGWGPGEMTSLDFLSPRDDAELGHQKIQFTENN